MTTLKTDKHGFNEKKTVVEIHDPELGLIGVIYPTERGVRIVSKHLDAGRDLVAIDPLFPLALEVFIT